jgi:hypothetical protein
MSMAGWYFIPITLQYLVGSGLIFLISFFLILKNSKSWVYRSFFLYGLFAGLWILMAFFHRNAPNAELSADFITVGAVFGLIFPAFLLITFLMLKKQSKLNLLALLPAIFLGAVTLYLMPFKISWTTFGWSYGYSSDWYFATFVVFNLAYVVANLAVGIDLIKTAPTELLRKKYAVLLISYFVFYVVAVSISNMLLVYCIDAPPLGGIFSALAFLAIAWALSLKFNRSASEKSSNATGEGERSHVKEAP